MLTRNAVTIAAALSPFGLCSFALPTLAAPPADSAVIQAVNHRSVELIDALVAGQSQSIAGHWQGMLVEQGASLPVSFDFALDAGNARGAFSCEQQRCLDFPLDSVTVGSANTVQFVLGGTFSFRGTVRGDLLSGSFDDGDTGQKGSFTLERSRPAPLRYRTVEVTFKNGPVVCSGTLCLPDSPGRHPAIVLLQGSGPETRWGTNRFFAGEFAKHGIAALCFDKRGTGQSTGNWQRSSFVDLADDAIAAVHLLQTRSDIDPHKIGLMGHSQGATIAPLVAARAPGDVAFLIAEDGAVGPMYEQDLYRTKNDLESAGLSAQDCVAALNYYREFLNVAITGKGWKKFNDATQKAKGSKWLDMLGIPPKGNWIYSFYPLIGNYDSLPFWRKVHVPVLIVYGEDDRLVPVEPSIKETEAALKESRNTRYKVVVIPHASHNLTISPNSGESFFWWHIAPGVNDLQIDWVRQQTM